MKSLAQFLAFVLFLAFLAALLFFRDGFYRFFFYLEEGLGWAQNPATDLVLENRVLAGENERLRALLADQAIKESDSASRRSARIYSRYPFADRASLIIDRGSKDNLSEGMPVLAAPGVLLGRLTKVRENFSEVETIFDPAWRSSVGIGQQQTKALLIGGAVPALDLIEPTAIVNDGDAINNLSPDFPYGLALGQLINLDKPLAQPWFRGELEPFFDLSSLKEVLVVGNFSD